MTPDQLETLQTKLNERVCEYAKTTKPNNLLNAITLLLSFKNAATIHLFTINKEV